MHHSRLDREISMTCSHVCILMKRVGFYYNWSEMRISDVIPDRYYLYDYYEYLNKIIHWNY